MRTLLGKLLPSRNERLLKTYRGTVNRINALEDACKQLDDSALQAKQSEFKSRLQNGEAIDRILPEAFAVVREAARRVLDMRPFDVQLMGGMVLHRGCVAEMSTGEGKTLVATMPAYLNALTGKSVHVVTVNDYLALRDAEWMGQVYRHLGMSVGVIVSGLKPAERHAAYQSDIVYGTNNEFGFDYLRDNMALTPDEVAQRNHYYAIIDEVDSVLIDEARTPLIISGPGASGTAIYSQIDKLVRPLKLEREEGDGGDYTVDEKSRQVMITESGHQHIEDLLAKNQLLEPGESLYDMGRIGLFHHVNSALRANAMYKKNVDYIVRGGKVVIVDEFTGRVMEGRRWSDGLHQAIEAKEGVRVEAENQTFASITFQNYFRLYEKLAGMTGTADTEAYELNDIYNLEVVVLPTHKKMIRDDLSDLVYLTQGEKFQAIVEDIKRCVGKGQPALVGTASIETSELLSALLKKAGIRHQVLNAKHHEAESRIIAQAGRPAVVTIATNMAGRGTDIILGGSLDAELAEAEEEADKEEARKRWQARHRQVMEAGGLHIIGTERHESRRIDNQLRGRAGRQGDPGSSQFYLSLEDNLMRIFASDKVKSIMDRIGMEEGEAIEHPWVSKAIENAQRKVEAYNYDIRKNLLDYDDVINEQRRIIYDQRLQLMQSEDISDSTETIMSEVVETLVNGYIPQSEAEEWDIDGLSERLKRDFNTEVPIASWFDDNPEITSGALKEKVLQEVYAAYADRRAEADKSQMRMVESVCMLQTLDRNWKEHLMQIDYLRRGIGFRSFAQKNPKQEYKREAFGMFEAMLDRIRHELIVQLAHLRIDALPEKESAAPSLDTKDLGYQHAPPADVLRPPSAASDMPLQPSGAQKAARPAKPETVRRKHPKLGRNDPCFCGSGKKYKRCCMRKAS